jgi:uncharacterized protein YjbI with pentapeptide repeats
MGARLRSWWQRVRKPLEIAVVTVGCILVIALLVVIVLAYIFNVNVPGLHGKTLWDWLQLLIVPLALAIIALFFQRTNIRTEQQIALDKQREELLQAYLDRMSELLLKEKLRSSEADAEVRNVARVRTITVLNQLDARRTSYVFAFLREAGLISTTPNDNVVSLIEADLHGVNWSHANLREVNLSGTNLSGANLTEADMSEAVLSKAYLERVNFSGAGLNNANFSGAILDDTNFSGAFIQGANFSGARLWGANLNGAFLNGANFSGALLWDADFSKTKATEGQLKKAKSLKGTTMPDRSIHP